MGKVRLASKSVGRKGITLGDAVNPTGRNWRREEKVGIEMARKKIIMKAKQEAINKVPINKLDLHELNRVTWWFVTHS